MNRVNWIDWAKALGILMVVMGHSNYDVPYLTEMIFMIHMPLFFFISGYLYKTNKTLKELTISNYRTLILPYFLFNLLSAFFVIILGVYKFYMHIPMDWSEKLVVPLTNSLLGVPGNLLCGVTWFLLALVWCRYLTTLVHMKNKYISSVVLMLWLGLLIIRNTSECQFYYCFDSGLAGFIWFEVGYIVKNYCQKLVIPKWSRMVLISGGGILCFIALKYNGQCNYLSANFKGLIGIIGTGLGLVSFFSLCKLLDSLHWKIIEKVSTASILIMGLHMIIMLPMQKLCHYQYHIIVTFIGDMFIVLIITFIYPWVQRYIPSLIGYRK